MIRLGDRLIRNGSTPAVLSLIICAAILNGQQPATDPNIDFRNFSYPFPSGEYLSVPGKMSWMSLTEKNLVTLVKGRYDFNKSDPAAGPSVILDQVLYGYLTSSKQLDAVVVLGYHTGGTAWWDYVYAFSLASGPPRLVGWFQAGSRAYFGLYHIRVSNRSLSVDLLEPAKRVGDCCSAGFVRINYEFRDGALVQAVPTEFGTVEQTQPKP